jgi:hypothetical protein
LTLYQVWLAIEKIFMGDAFLGDDQFFVEFVEVRVLG